MFILTIRKFDDTKQNKANMNRVAYWKTRFAFAT